MRQELIGVVNIREVDDVLMFVSEGLLWLKVCFRCNCLSFPKRASMSMLAGLCSCDYAASLYIFLTLR